MFSSYCTFLPSSCWNSFDTQNFRKKYWCFSVASDLISTENINFRTISKKKHLQNQKLSCLHKFFWSDKLSIKLKIDSYWNLGDGCFFRLVYTHQQKSCTLLISKIFQSLTGSHFGNTFKSWKCSVLQYINTRCSTFQLHEVLHQLQWYLLQNFVIQFAICLLQYGIRNQKFWKQTSVKLIAISLNNDKTDIRHKKVQKIFTRKLEKLGKLTSLIFLRTP